MNPFDYGRYIATHEEKKADLMTPEQAAAEKYRRFMLKRKQRQESKELATNTMEVQKPGL